MAGAIEEYIDEFGRALRGPRRAKADLLTEARDSLHDAAAAYEEAGLRRPDAERRAVADFGAVRDIAPDYQTELAIAQSRRTALLLLAVVVIQPVLWQEVARFAEFPGRGGGTLHTVVDRVTELLGMTTVGAAVLAVIALGVGSRYLPRGGRRAVTRAVGTGTMALCAAFAGLGIVMCLLTAEHALSIRLMWLTVFLLLPLSVVAATAGRCLSSGS